MNTTTTSGKWTVKVTFTASLVFAVLFLGFALYTWISGNNAPVFVTGLLFLIAALSNLRIALTSEEDNG